MDLARLVAEFRDEYALANNDAVRAMDQGGWDLVWNAVVSRAVEDLLVPGTDAFAVRRRLERVADWYRRAVCDPVRLFGSLAVQEAVASGLARLEQWCEEEGPSSGTMMHHDAGPATAEWRCVLRHPDAFRDWPVDAGAAQHDPQFQWRIAQNLYTSPHDEPGTRPLRDRGSEGAWPEAHCRDCC